MASGVGAVGAGAPCTALLLLLLLPWTAAQADDSGMELMDLVRWLGGWDGLGGGGA